MLAQLDGACQFARVKAPRRTARAAYAASSWLNTSRGRFGYRMQRRRSRRAGRPCESARCGARASSPRAFGLYQRERWLVTQSALIDVAARGSCVALACIATMRRACCAPSGAPPFARPSERRRAQASSARSGRGAGIPQSGSASTSPQAATTEAARGDASSASSQLLSA
jgi:hypothetical protein